MDSQHRSVYLTPFKQNLLLKALTESHLSTTYRRRLEIMLLADAGKSQVEISKDLNCARETVRYWITVASIGQAHYWELSPLGRPKSVNDQYLKRLKELVSFEPKIFGYSYGRWTASRLCKHLAQEFGIDISARHINRLLKQMGLSTKDKNIQIENQTSQESNVVINEITVETSSFI